MPVMLRVNKKFRKIAEKILNLKGKMFDRRKKDARDIKDEDASKTSETLASEEEK